MGLARVLRLKERDPDASVNRRPLPLQGSCQTKPKLPATTRKESLPGLDDRVFGRLETMI